MDITNVVLVLGKRLVNNALTLEGKQRVDALATRLQHVNLAQTVIIFCGGVTHGQVNSEAQAMFDHFSLRLQGEMPPHVLIEDTSTNTIENIVNAADKLIASKLCHEGQSLEVMFVSHDYHLERIFEIQTLMDEQGLLRSLKTRCANNGLQLNIATNTDAHCVVPYPHRGVLAQAFLKLDELTTYRVYLEGVQSHVFHRPLAEVRALPYRIARAAMDDLKPLITDAHDKAALKSIEQVLENTPASIPADELVNQVSIYHQHLTRLNRKYDPEQHNPI